MKLLGVQIANGYSSEARVCASLLASCGEAYDPMFLIHEWEGDQESATRFQCEAGIKLVRRDFGWRPNPDGGRSRVAKLGSRLRFHAVLPALLKTARAFDPDAVYSCQQRWDCAAAAYLARRLAKPQVIHLHYTVGPWLGRDVLQHLRTCDQVVAVSDFIRSEALQYGLAPERVATIRNAMRPFPSPAPGTREAVRAELGVPSDAPLIGIVARLEPGKGQNDTIEAFAKLASRHPTAQLLIVGDGSERAALEDRANQTGVRDRIVFAGRRADVPRLLAAMDVFAHPSRFDPCPLALLEAMAAGLPTVSYAEGGAPEIVADKLSGLLAPAGDVNELAACLVRLLEEPDTARWMGAAGKQRLALEFCPDDSGRAFVELLQRTVARDAPRSARFASDVQAGGPRE